MLERMNKSLISALVLFLILGFSVISFAFEMPEPPDGFPENRIVLVTPTAPGGSYDLLARGIAKFAPKYMGVDFVVNNMPGASMTIGAEYIANARPDGYTLGVSACTPWIWVSLELGTDFCTIEDIEYIAIASETARCWTMNPDLDFDNLAEVFEYAKENPGRLSLGTASMTTNVEATLLMQEGYRFSLIPYGSGGEAAADNAGGHIDLNSGTYAASSALVEAGMLTLLAYDGPKGTGAHEDWMPHIDDYPEIAEIIGVIPNTRTAVQAPKGVPEDRLEFIEAALLKTFQSEEFQEYAVSVGLNPVAIGRAEYTEGMHSLYNKAQDMLDELF